MQSVERIKTGRLVRQLLNLGATPGAALLVHSSFSKVGPVEGGPMGLITALRDTLGPKGTLIMPSMSSDDDHPFDPSSTDCLEMGVVPDSFWRCPDVLRSDNPHAFAAVGPLAKKITAPHPVSPPHGLDSPVGRAYELDAFVLLLGVGQEANTTIHLAENLAKVRYSRATYVTILEHGEPVRFEYGEVDHCCRKFALVDDWLDEGNLQRRGVVGHGEARLARSRDIVKAVTDRINADETIFLHPKGVDDDCDAAWDSLSETIKASEKRLETSRLPNYFLFIQ